MPLVLRRNKAPRATNKIRDKAGKELKPNVIMDNLYHSHNVFPEAILYLLVKDHPLIMGGSLPKRSTASCQDSNFDPDLDNSADRDKESLLK